MTREDFLNAYYFWSLEDARRECSEGFPLVSRVRSRMTLRFLYYSQALGSERTETLMRALVLRFHPQAAEVAGHRLDPDSTSLIEEMRLALRSPCPDEPPDPPSTSGPGRRRLSAAIDERLGLVPGGARHPLGASQWFYERSFGGLRLRTFIDVGGRTHQLTYHQRIDAPGLPEVGGWISLFSWLGIAGQTDWDLLGSEDAASAAESIRDFCGHFETGFLRRTSASF